MRGIISKIFDWVLHPVQSEGTTGEWVLGLALILMLSFLWSTVVKQTVE